MNSEIRITVSLDRKMAQRAIDNGDAIAAVFQPEGLALMMKDRPRLQGIGSVPKPTGHECRLYVVTRHADDEVAKQMVRVVGDHDSIIATQTTVSLINHLATKEGRDPLDVASEMCSAVPLDDEAFYKAMEEQRFDLRAIVTQRIPGMTKLIREEAETPPEAREKRADERR